MASKVAEKRLQKEYLNMQRSPPPFIWASPEEKNILDWHFIIRGPPDTPYDGGEYHGLIWFPPEYPFKPPDVKLFTPSGRFTVGQKICMSMTSYHPSTWNAAWSVATILTGLLSFMLTDEVTAGGIKATEEERRALAKTSHAFNLKSKKFRDVFPTYSTPEMTDLPDMGHGTGKSQVNASRGNSATTTPASSTTTSTRAPTPLSAHAHDGGPPGHAGPGHSPLGHSSSFPSSSSSSSSPTTTTSTTANASANAERDTETNGVTDTYTLNKTAPAPVGAARQQQARSTSWFSWRVVVVVVMLAVLGRISSRIGA